MADTLTPNIGIAYPTHLGDVGSWDTPLNTDWVLLDLMLGAVTTIGLNNSNVVLSAGQFQSKQIIFNSTLAASVTITFPTTFIKSYEVYHTCTGSSAFTITLQTTAAAGQVICAAPGQIINVSNDGANLRYINLGGHVGSYWDHAGSSVPNWVSGCTVPPYIQCNSTTFSSATYPQLAMYLGGTTTPDHRGRARHALDQSAGLVSSGGSGSGVAGNTLFAVGGSQLMQQHAHNYTDPGHTHGHNAQINSGGNLFESNAGPNEVNAAGGATINSATIGITINNAGSGGFQNMPPVLIHGITMIRAG